MYARRGQRQQYFVLLPVTHKIREIDTEKYVFFLLYMTVLNCFILFKKNTPQTKIKRAKDMVSRTSHLTEFTKSLKNIKWFMFHEIKKKKYSNEKV
jgi:hypothetical protein